MAVTFPQVKFDGFSSSSASFSLSFTSGIAAGSFIAFSGMFDPAATSATFSITGTGAGASSTDSGKGFILNTSAGTRSFLGAFLSPTTGTQTVKMTFVGSNAAYGDLVLWEIAGLTSPVFDQVAEHDNPAGGPNPNSGATGTLSSATEAAVGFFCTGGLGTSITMSPGTPVSDGITPSGNGSAAVHEIVGSTSALTTSGTDGNNSANSCWVATFMSGSGTPAVTIGWSRASDPERPGPIKLQSDARSAFVPLFTTAKTPSGIVWLTGADKERLPPIKENPDPAKQWFVRSPNPVPTTWLPKAGGGDIERPAAPKPSVEQSAFIKAPTPPVPISGMAWHISKEEKRPPPPPDQYVVTWMPEPIVSVTYMVQTNADDLVIRPRILPGDGAPGWTPKPPAAQVNTISGMAWWQQAQTQPTPPAVWWQGNPPWPFPLPPPSPTVTVTYANQFFAGPGMMMGIPGNPPS